MINKLFLLFLFCSILNFSQTISDSSLICYYPLDGDAKDHSGNELNGFLLNVEPTISVIGNENEACHFTGDFSHILIPSDQSLKQGFPLSFSCWIKPDSYQVPIFTNDFQDDIYSGVLFFIASTGQLGVTIGNGGTIGEHSRHTKVGYSQLNLNEWYHVAFVIRDFYDIDIYINSVVENGYYEGYGNSLVYTDGNAAIGMKDQSINGPPAYYSGSIDELYFFNRQLQLSEITQLYTQSESHIVVTLAKIEAAENDTVSLPIFLDVPNGYEISSLELQINFPTDSFDFIDIVTEGTMLENTNWLISKNIENEILNISGAGSNNLIENGNLLSLKFQIKNSLNTGYISLKFKSAIFNDGSTLALFNHGGIVLTDYIQIGDADLNSKIQALDASYILKFLAGMNLFNEEQMFAADVSLDSSVSALDAKLILDYTTGLIDTLPYEPSPNLKHAVGNIYMPENVNENNGIVKIPIEVVQSENIISFEAGINYNPLRYKFAGIEWGDKLSEFNVELSDHNGRINLAGFGESIGVSNFTFGEITLQKITTSYSPSAVSFSSIRWNEDYEKKNVAHSFIDIPTEVEILMPDKFELHQNYPNPFNPTTVISFSIPVATNVQLKVYDILGNEIITLVNETKIQGSYQVDFDASNLSSGLYFYSIKTHVGSISKKMVLVK